MTISARAAKFAIAWLKRAHPYLLREAVVPEGSHIQRNGERKALRAKYPRKGE
jgi:hypothetical protein